MIALHRAAALSSVLMSSLLLPATVIAAEPVAPVSETLRPEQGQAVVAAPASEPTRPVQTQASAAAATRGAAYVPKTAYDNSPYRFNAGARFTAAEFDAWMKSRGIRVAKGKPAAAAATGATTGLAVENTACNTQAVSDC